MLAKRRNKPTLVLLPQPGERVCLDGVQAYTDSHDHGTAVAVDYRGDAWHALVEWDDSHQEGAEWCLVSMLDPRCTCRQDRTPYRIPSTVTTH